jgi:hypothetical protein
MFSIFKKNKKIPASVEVNEKYVIHTRSNGQVEIVTWDEMRAVMIETTADGPFETDVFWILVGKDNGCVIPTGTNGEEKLLDRLQKLPGFDNQAMIDAMCCTENKRFLCWEKVDVIRD